MLGDSVNTLCRSLLFVGLLLGSGVTGARVALAADPTSHAVNETARVEVLSIVPGIYMVTVEGVNVAVQTGPDGTLLVNTGPQNASGPLLAAIRKIADQPIRYLIDTGADPTLIGGNGIIAAAGQSPQDMDRFAAFYRAQLSGVLSLPGAGSVATIIARQGVLTQMASEPGVNYENAALPTETFARDQFNFFFNEPIAIIATPHAHSNSDAVVRFERSDVVVAGAIFDETRFPVIDLKRGGSIQGEIDGLNRLINTLVFAHVPVLVNAGGTMVIPIRGPLSDADDLLTYRDMISMVRARIYYYMGQGKTLTEIEGLDPTEGYEGRYGAETGDWTTKDFVDAVYDSLKAERDTHRGRR